MNDTCNYLIRLLGLVDVDDANLMSPLRMARAAGEGQDPGVTRDLGMTLVTVRTDQSGIIGLMRYLHGLGIVLHSIARQDNDKNSN